jgi:hypothetical protein
VITVNGFHCAIILFQNGVQVGTTLKDSISCMPNSLDGTELARNVLLDARPVNNTKAQIWEQFAWNAMAAIILDFVPIVIKHCSSPC